MFDRDIRFHLFFQHFYKKKIISFNIFKKLKFKILYLLENNPLNPLTEYSIFEFFNRNGKTTYCFFHKVPAMY